MKVVDVDVLVRNIKDRFGDDVSIIKVCKRYEHEFRSMQVQNEEAKSEKINNSSNEEMFTEGCTVANECWLEIKKEILKDYVKFLCEYDFPHFIVMSADDMGDKIELIYHLMLYRESERGFQVFLNTKVYLLKDDLNIESLYDLIPGIEYSEREIRDMMGVNFEGLPVKDAVFVPDDLPEKALPWRKDDKAPGDELIRVLD